MVCGIAIRNTWKKKMLHFSPSNHFVWLWRLNMMLISSPHNQIFSTLPAKCLWLCCLPQHLPLAWDNEQVFQLLFYLDFNKVLQALVIRLLYYEYIFKECVFTRFNTTLGIRLNSTFSKPCLPNYSTVCVNEGYSKVSLPDNSKQPRGKFQIPVLRIDLLPACN